MGEAGFQPLSQHSDRKREPCRNDDDETTTEIDSETEDYLFGKPASKPQPSVPARLWNFIETQFCRLFSSLVLKYILSILLGLLPSFITNLFKNSSSSRPGGQGIAALDGLRGLACLFVFNSHFTLSYTEAFNSGYRSGHQEIMNWPVVRLMWSGKVMVDIFFVISGYVLSYKPLKGIRAKSADSFHKSISSSVIRRALRLYLPPFFDILLTALAVRLGFFEQATYNYSTEMLRLNTREAPPPYLDSFFDQIKDALKDCMRIMDNTVPWEYPTADATKYDNHLWTIPLEFGASMALFVVLVGTSRLRASTRLYYHFVLIAYSFYTECHTIFLFFTGMTLAELDLIRADRYSTPKYLSAQATVPTGVQAEYKALPVSATDASPNPSRPRRARIHPKLVTLLWILICCAGLFLASCPAWEASSTPGYISIIDLTQYFFSFTYPADSVQSVGSVLIVWPIANSPFLAPVFTNPVTKYLGNISYALYLVHGNVIKSLGYVVIPWAYGVAGVPNARWSDTLNTTELLKAWLLGAVCIVPAVIWLSDIFWRVIDKKCVRLAHWAETKALHRFWLGRAKVTATNSAASHGRWRKWLKSKTKKTNWVALQDWRVKRSRSAAARREERGAPRA